MARSFRRMVASATYSSGEVVRIDLPRNHVFKNLLLNATFDVTISGGSTSGTPADETPQNLLSRVRVIRNGSEVVQSLSGADLYTLATINRGTPPRRTTLADADAQSNTALQVDIPIDFASLRLSNPSLTLLRAVGTTSLVLEITFGTATNLVYGGDRTLAVNSGTVKVLTQELTDLSGTYADKELEFIEKTLTASQSDFEFDFPTGPIYRRILFKAADNGLLNLRNDIINTVTIQSDGIFAHLQTVDYDTLRGFNKEQYNLDTALDGYIVCDFAENGALNGMIDTQNASDFKAKLDVTFQSGSTNKIVAITEKIIPARQAA